jgi:hypothetical protein
MNGRRFVQVPPSSRGMLPATMHRMHRQRDFVEHEDPTQPFPEGDVDTPEACWFQHPEAQKISKYYRPERQWGDSFTSIITDNQKVTFGQRLDLRLHIPAVVVLRLSAQDTSGILTEPDANLFVTWQVDIGCGRALQILSFTQNVMPLLGGPGAPFAGTPVPSTNTDIYLQLPVQALRASGTIVDNFSAVGNKYNVTCVAMAAPITSRPDMVSR